MKVERGKYYLTCDGLHVKIDKHVDVGDGRLYAGIVPAIYDEGRDGGMANVIIISENGKQFFTGEQVIAREASEGEVEQGHPKLRTQLDEY